VVQPWKHDESITFATTVARHKQFVQSFVQVKRGRIQENIVGNASLLREEAEPDASNGTFHYEMGL
jgi:hypothetical protein